MSMSIANRPNIPSGIVLYPETGNFNDFTAAEARQFGMAVNAHVEADEVLLSPVHAVGYDPRLAVDLRNVHYSGDRLALELNESDQAQERIILDELGRTMQGELDQRGLAREGLAHALQLRRVDIIVPAEIGREHALGLAESLSCVAGTKYLGERVQPQLWKIDDDMVVNLMDGAPAYGHPLHNTVVGMTGSTPSNYVVKTGRATLLPQVRESIRYTSHPSDTRLANSGPGFQLTTSSQELHRFIATYGIPTGENRTVLHALAELDLQNQQRLHAFEDKTNVPNSDWDVIVDLDLGSPHEGYIDRTDGKRRTLARLLDPADHPAWNEQLN